MPRKRADLVAAAKRPEGRAVIWAAMRQLRAFSILDLEDATRIGEETIRTYVTGLTRAGYLERIEGERRATDPLGRYVRNRWRLVRDIGVDAPRVTRQGAPVTQGLAREQMWRTLKLLRSDFSARDLAVHASTQACPVDETDAKSYLQYLHKGGYLVRTQDGGPGRPARWRFLPRMNTGPQPPQVQRVKQLWDPNLGEVMWPKQVTS